LIIETDNQALDIIKNLAEKKKVKLVKVKETVISFPVEIMDDLATKTAIPSIKDPVTWQTEIGSDRNFTL